MRLCALMSSFNLILDLPVELIAYELITYLEVLDVRNLSMTCRSMHTCIDNEETWRRIYHSLIDIKNFAYYAPIQEYTWRKRCWWRELEWTCGNPTCVGGLFTYLNRADVCEGCWHSTYYLYDPKEDGPFTEHEKLFQYDGSGETAFFHDICTHIDK